MLNLRGKGKRMTARQRAENPSEQSQANRKSAAPIVFDRHA
jgi:hypothetical protein